ncbi:MAG: hypothetical protein R2710_04590 [Acidimicrobiales bacterium]
MFKQLMAATAIVGSVLAPAGLAGASEHRPLVQEIGIGLVYETFDETDNQMLFVGGSVGEFCEDNPADPFNAEPGSAMARVFVHRDGAVTVKATNQEQPAYLYRTGAAGGPPWIEAVCADMANGAEPPEAFATGAVALKLRVTEHSPDLVDVFNSTRGTVTSADGSRFRVRSKADFILENGMPAGDPTDFVELDVRPMCRR